MTKMLLENGRKKTPTAKQQLSNETFPVRNAGKVCGGENLSAVSGAPRLYWCVVPAGFSSLFLSVCVLFCFFSSRQKHLLLMTRHEAPEAKDRYLCPEYSSIEGIVSVRAAAWFNKMLNSAPSRPAGPKHLKAEVPLGALREQRMNTNNNNVTLIVLRVSAAGTL